MESSASAPLPRFERIEFVGTGGEYFRIWIVNLLLTIITLGIYSAWAKVRREQYFHGSTRVAGHAFGYHATGGQIFRGRMIAALVFFVYAFASEIWPKVGLVLAIAFIFALPAIVTLARRFQLRMTSWRGVRFNFESGYGAAAASLLVAPILSVLSLGLLLPWATRLRYRWMIDNSSYGSTRFNTTVGLKPLVFAVLGAAAVGVLVFVLFVFALLPLMKQTTGGMASEGPTTAGLVLIAMIYLPVLLGGYLMMAVWRRGVLNAVLPATTMGPLKLDCQLSARRLALIYLTNFIGIVLTFGLFTPWARVRAAKYQLESTGVHVTASLDQFVAGEAETSSAVGEELGEMFDVGAQI